MALLVWLPLNGNLKNLGTAKVTVTNNGATIDNNGRIGKCYYFNGSSYIRISVPIGMTTIKNISICAWVKSTSSTLALGGISHDTDASKAGCTLYTSGWQLSGAGGWKYVSSGTIANTSTWHHTCCTIADNNITTYLDGVLIGTSSLSSLGVTTTDLTSSNFIEIGCDHPGGDEYLTGYVNDFRIYDHCLSPEEVSEIAKGLVLHYKLDDGNIETTTNYLPSPYRTSYSTYAPGWDASKHPNAININNWSAGYNGGVSSPSIGYHAMWNMIEEIPTIVFLNHNSEVNLSGRWLGVSAGITTSIAANVKYTISYELRSIDTLGGYTTCGIYYKRTSSDSTNFYDGCPEIGRNTKLNTWERFSHTFTRSSAVDGTGNNGSIYIYGMYGTESTMQVRNVQLEIKDHSTPFVMYSTTRNNTEIIDSSGYGNNGILSGNIIISTDTTRYNISTKLNDSASAIAIGNLSTIVPEGIFTFNIWFKKITGEWSSKGYETILGGPSGFELEMKKSGTNSPVLWLYSWGLTEIAYTLDEWHMLTMVRTTSDSKYYLDGLQVLTGSAGSIPSGNYFIGAWRDNVSLNYRGLLSDARIYATALTAQQIYGLYKIESSVDNKHSIHTYELNENYSGNIIGVKLINNSASSMSYDKNTDTYTIVSPVGTSSWGYGVRIGETPPTIVPYGLSYYWSADIYSPVATNIVVDYNNTTADGSATWSGNDNDLTSSRRASSFSIPANIWTHIICGTSNTNSSNTNHIGLRDYSNIGLSTNGLSNSVTWKIKNFLWSLLDNSNIPLFNNNGQIIGLNFTEIEDALKTSLSKNLGILADNLIEM